MNDTHDMRKNRKYKGSKRGWVWKQVIVSFVKLIVH